jgi:hypothetical protein
MGDTGLSHKTDLAEDVPGLKACNRLPPEEDIRPAFHQNVHPEIQIPLPDNAPVCRHVFPCCDLHEIVDFVRFENIEECDFIEKPKQNGLLNF